MVVIVILVTNMRCTHGRKTCLDLHNTWVLKTRLIEKKYPSFLLMPNFRKLRDDSKYVSLKIGSWKPQKLGPFSSLFLMRKTLSSGQKWFLRPYFPLIRGMYVSVEKWSFYKTKIFFLSICRILWYDKLSFRQLYITFITWNSCH